MRTLVVTSFLAILIVVGRAASAQEEAPPPVPRLPHAFVTADELANPQLYHPYWHLEAYVPPPVYAAPPPAGSIRPGEFDPMDSVIIAPMNYGSAFTDMFVEMVAAYAAGGHVWIVATGSYKATFEARLVDAGVPAAAYSYLNYPTDTIWIRDYGPEFVVDPDGVRHMWDSLYQGGGRPLDDAVPLEMAAGDWMNGDGSPMDVMISTEHTLSGGNIMTDGAGTCFFSNIVYGYEKPAGWTQDDVDDLMAEYLGCEQIITLQSICLDGTGHIDLYAKVMDRTSILLGEYPPDTHFDGATESNESVGFCADPHHPNDYQDMEDNLATLEGTQNLDGEDWVITRLPMPEPYFDGDYWVVRSYMNSQIFNDVVAMPSYYDEQDDEWTETADELLNLEAEAIAAYEAARPGVTVIPIDSDAIIPLAGAIHCITHEIPQEAGGEWVAPEEYCGDGIRNGEEACDGDDFGGQDCADFGFAPGDFLACLPGCVIGTDECPSAGCGDGVVDEDAGEECDPCAPEQALCDEYGLGAGEVGCNLDCTISTFDCAEASPCAALAALDPGVVCCPDEPPTDCDDGSWDWSPEDSYYGCCYPDLTGTMYCYNGLQQYGCGDDGYCQYVTDGYVDCANGEMPGPAEPADCGDAGVEDDAGADADTDADAGPGGGSDDGCGCAAAGTPGIAGPLALILG